MPLKSVRIRLGAVANGCCGLSAGLGVLAMVLIFAAIQRFHDLTHAGMYGSDTFEYWMYVDQILHAHLNTKFNRLAAYSINVAAVKALGANDYAMRFAVALASLLNGAAAFWLTWRLGRNGIAAAAAAAVYCLLPVVVTYSRTELLHTYSGLFVLANTAALMVAVGGARRRLAVVAVGFFACLAMLTHEDLALMMAASGLILAATPPAAFASGRFVAWPSLRSLVEDCVLALAGVGAAFAVCMAVTGGTPWEWYAGLLKVRHVVDYHTHIRIGDRFFSGAVGPRILAEFFVHTMGWIVIAAGLAICAGVAVAWRHGRVGVLTARRFAVPAVVVVVYTTLFILSANAYMDRPYQRIFVPFVPLVLIGIFSGISLVLPRPWLAGAVASTLAAVILTSLGAPVMFPGIAQVSPHRQVYDVVKSLVNRRERLFLPACYQGGERYVGLSSTLYLGERALPLGLTDPDTDFATFVRRERVRYALVVNKPVLRTMRATTTHTIFSLFYQVEIPEGVEASLRPPTREQWTGPTDLQWSAEACALENDAERAAIARLGGLMVATVSNLGEIYDLGRRQDGGYILGSAGLSDANGDILPTGNIAGWVEGATREADGYQIAGWAVDPAAPAPVQLLVFIDGFSVHTAMADRTRVDVDTALNISAPAAGFKFIVPFAVLGDVANHVVRVVAITEDHRAKELSCNPKNCVFVNSVPQ
jgi:hypothetical protein